jgi:ATP-dependent exoDNAse (exonuclease V) alpha subunit
LAGKQYTLFFRLAWGQQDPDSVNNINDTILVEKLTRLSMLIIDEVSMVRVDILAMIDKKLKIANENNRPFGGKQVIMFGDPFQLPPVVDGGQLLRYFCNTYGSEFFFSAPAYKTANIKTYKLNKIFRQTDDAFIDMLNKIRVGVSWPNFLDSFSERFKVVPPC